MQPSTNPAVLAAMRSVAAAAPTAARDPLRPVFHFRPPANWMNDPNGTIFHQGVYHLFYQHNPYGDMWGHMHWGHATSRDLVHWEHAPIALWPSLEQGEAHCFSGCAVLDAAGAPLLLYTKVGPDHRAPNRSDWEQWAATGDASWRTWQKHPQNPILQVGGQGAPPFDGDWRDPYVFHTAGRTFLVLGVTQDNIAGVAIYEALDGNMASWRYCNLLYQKPKEEIAFFECPNFIPLGRDQWLLLSSPYTPVQYVVGRFEIESTTFVPQRSGILDPGVSEGVPAHYYATNTAFAPDSDGEERCILFGWIRGFPEGKGWNGCLALPRELTLGDDGHPRQRPVAELAVLRRDHTHATALSLHNGHHALAQGLHTCEILARLAPETGAQGGVSLFGPPTPETWETSIAYDGHTLWIAGQEIAYVRSPTQTELTLHIFVDRSVLEVFVDDGRLVVTRVIQPPARDLTPTLCAWQGSVHFQQCDVWQIASIW